jgi:hypothetical protein
MTYKAEGMKRQMRIHPIEIKGNWDKGYVLDQHVLSSVPKGEREYDKISDRMIR